MTTYTDQDKARAIAVFETESRNRDRASAITGVPPTTIRAWAHDDELREKLADDIDKEKNGMIAQFKKIVTTYADRLLAPEVIEQAKARDIPIIIGVAFDKMRLLQGESTANNAQAIDLKALLTIVQSLPDDQLDRIHTGDLSAVSNAAANARAHEHADSAHTNASAESGESIENP